MDLKRIILPLFFFTFALACTLPASPRYSIREYSTRDGLAQRRVSDILQDTRGFMWFSTWDGLTRFDGSSFVSYTNSAGRYGRLYNNRINYIRENSLGDIWCSTNDGRVYLFDTWTEQYLDVLASVEEEYKQRFSVTMIYPLSKGVTWLVCSGGYAFRTEDHGIKQGKGITVLSTFDRTLKGDTVHLIHQDSDGNEWLLTDRGTFVHEKSTAETGISATMIAENSLSLLLVSPDGRMAVYDKETRIFSYPKPDFPLGPIHSIVPVGNSSYGLATENGALLFDFRTGQFRHFDLADSGVQNSAVSELYPDSQGILWAITPTRGIVRIDPKNGQSHLIYPYREPVVTFFPPYSVYEDRHGTLWIVPLNENIGYYDPERRTLQTVETHRDAEEPRHSVFVGRPYTDTQGNQWIAHANGVSRISYSMDYASFVPEDSDHETRALLTDRWGRIWTGSKSGTIRIYDPDKQIMLYLAGDGRWSQYYHRFASSASSGIYTIFEDSAGRLWVGTKGDGLYVLTPQENDSFKVSHYLYKSSDPYSISDNEVYSVFEDSRKRMWVGCFREGINVAEPDENGGIRFINRNNRIKHYPAGEFASVRHITEGPGGVMMAGTAGGLLTFSGDAGDSENVRFHVNTHRFPEGTGLSGGNVMHILRTRNDDIFVTTFDGSIQKVLSRELLSDTIRFRRYQAQPDRAIPGLAMAAVEDPQGQIWIISENALTCFDPVRERFDPFNIHMFLRGNYFTEAVPVFDRNGQMLVGAYGGYVSFLPGRMAKSEDTPPIAFTEITLQGKSSRKLFRCDSLRVTPDARNLSIRFATLDYVDAVKIQYAYRLKGLQDEWNYTTENRSVSYINLPKGSFRFQVRSTNNKGHWVENTVELPIEVLPRFRETAWGWALFGLAVAGAIIFAAISISYVYRLRYRVSMEQQLADVKLRFFTDISHELRTPLTLIASPVSEVLEREPLSTHAREYLTVVKKNVDRMMQLVNQILDFRKIQSKRMKLLVEQTDLSALLHRIMDGFRLIAEENRIDFHLEEEGKAVWCWIDRDKFEKIVFNLLSNAFKFTPPGKSITVRLSSSEDKAFISVIDTGIGIPPGKLPQLFERFGNTSAYDSLQPSSGIGLSLVRELTLLHHGRVEVFSRENEGSEFRITLSCGRTHFEKDKYTEWIVSDSHDTADEKTVQAMDGNGETETAPDERPSLLIVEDNPELAGFLRSVFGQDYRVRGASNGQEGLEKVFAEQPDFIVSDVMMPVMDGLEMIRRIKENPDTCHIPVVILSAKSSLDDRIHALEYGIDDYMTKPFSSSYLKARIAALIEQRRRLQEQLLTTLTGNGTAELSPSKPQIVPFDQQFMERLMSFMEEHMDHTELTVDELASAMDMSRPILYRKLKSIVGLSPVDFIRTIRIKRAVQLIDTGEFSFSEIAYMTGFGDPKYFGKCFKKQIGVTPSEYKSGKKPNRKTE